jgi:hypothetical protein
VAKDLVTGYFGLRVEDGEVYDWLKHTAESNLRIQMPGEKIGLQTFHVLSPTDVILFGFTLSWDFVVPAAPQR